MYEKKKYEVVCLYGRKTLCSPQNEVLKYPSKDKMLERLLQWRGLGTFPLCFLYNLTLIRRLNELVLRFCVEPAKHSFNMVEASEVDIMALKMHLHR